MADSLGDSGFAYTCLGTAWYRHSTAASQRAKNREENSAPADSDAKRPIRPGDLPLCSGQRVIVAWPSEEAMDARMQQRRRKSGEASSTAPDAAAARRTKAPAAVTSRPGPDSDVDMAELMARSMALLSLQMRKNALFLQREVFGGGPTADGGWVNVWVSVSVSVCLCLCLCV